jgi:hypothetical protein
MSIRFNIDLEDGMYDWNVKAVLIRNYPQVYEQINNQNKSLFNDNGRLRAEFGLDKDLEESIYARAKSFQFDDSKELQKLLRLEDMQRLKSRNYISSVNN